MSVETDEEMPITEHIEEMVKRLMVVIVLATVGMVISFIYSQSIIDAVWYNFVSMDPHTYSPLEQLVTQLKLSSIIGIGLALPVLVYEMFKFMEPGLYPHEERYYISVVPVSVFLELVGIAFSYFIALPVLFSYFMYYSEGVAQPGLGLRETFNLILMFSIGMGIVFQIPLVMFLGVKMNVASKEWFQRKRVMVWGACITVAAVISGSFDPTGVAGFVVGGTMIGLYEFTILLMRFTERVKGGDDDQHYYDGYGGDGDGGYGGGDSFDGGDGVGGDHAEDQNHVNDDGEEEVEEAEFDGETSQESAGRGGKMESVKGVGDEVGEESNSDELDSDTEGRDSGGNVSESDAEQGSDTERGPDAEQGSDTEQRGTDDDQPKKGDGEVVGNDGTEGMDNTGEENEGSGTDDGKNLDLSESGTDTDQGKPVSRTEAVEPSEDDVENTDGPESGGKPDGTDGDLKGSDEKGEPIESSDIYDGDSGSREVVEDTDPVDGGDEDGHGSTGEIKDSVQNEEGDQDYGGSDVSDVDSS
ncbi:MAG: twin-arginine translocase subunit TatC [Halobacteria archaeon]